MIRKGILKGDKSFRKFTFDDSKCVNGKYECTYPMDPVERNEFSEPNKVWLSESEMLVIGGPIKKKAPEQNPNQIEQPVEQPKAKTQSTVPEKRNLEDLKRLSMNLHRMSLKNQKVLKSMNTL